MSEWQLLEFDQDSTISGQDIVSFIGSNSDRNICISFQSCSEFDLSIEEAKVLLQTALNHQRIVAIFLNGIANGCLLTLALSSDLLFLTTDSIFSLTGLEDTAIVSSATAVGSRLSKAQAIQFFLKECHKATELHELGLITEIVTVEEFTEPLKYLSSFMNTVKESAIIRLKELWRNTSSFNKIDALAAERLEFAKCFELGAADSIAAYLQNRFKTNKD